MSINEFTFYTGVAYITSIKNPFRNSNILFGGDFIISCFIEYGVFEIFFNKCLEKITKGIMKIFVLELTETQVSLNQLNRIEIFYIRY